MEIYNPLIRATEALLSSTPDYTWAFYPSDAWKDTGTSELVLQKDTAFELGARGKGSANYVLFTSDTGLVPDDKISVYGSDLPSLKGDCDFARIVLLRVGVLEGDDETVYRTLKDIEFAKYHIYPEGYMVRMSPESYREQVRVSKDAMRRRISFRNIGASYVSAYKKNSNVLAASVIFVTDPAFDYKAMQETARKATEITNTLTHIFEGIPTDCSICALKDVCDEVEGMKELHFGVGDKGTSKH